MIVHKQVFLAIRTGNNPGEGVGTAFDPVNASTPEAFDKALRDLVVTGNVIPDLEIILGPGLFRTRGGLGAGYGMPLETGWRPGFNWRIRGAGQFLTTLRLDWTNVSGTNAQIAQRHVLVANQFLQADVLHHAFLGALEISDLTFDCTNRSRLFIPNVSSLSYVGSVGVNQTLVTATGPVFSAAMVGRDILFPQEGTPPAPVLPAFRATITQYLGTHQVVIDAGPLPETGAMVGRQFVVLAVKFTVSATAAIGENVRLRRVRIIDFVTPTSALSDGISLPIDVSAECFGMGAGGRGRLPGESFDRTSFNSVIEDCIVEQPFCCSAREVTSCVVGSGVNPGAIPPDKLHLQPFGNVIRNCHFDFDFINPRNGPENAVTGVTYSGTKFVALATLFPHNVSAAAGDFVEVKGAAVAAYNGRWPVTEPAGDSPTSRMLKIELATDPGQGTGGTMTVEQSFLPTLRIASITYNPANQTFTVTTSQPHKRKPADQVVISGAEQVEYNGTFKVLGLPAGTDLQFTYKYEAVEPITPPAVHTATGVIFLDRRPNETVLIHQVNPIASGSNFPYPTTAEIKTYLPHFKRVGDWVALSRIVTNVVINGQNVATTNNAFNNYVQVTEHVSRTSFRCLLPNNWNVGTLGAYSAAQDASFGTLFQAMSNNGGFGGGVFRNRVNSANRGLYHDFWWEQQAITRKNYFHNVDRAADFVFGERGLYYVADNVLNGGYSSGIVKSSVGTTLQVRLTTAGADPGFQEGVALQIWDVNSPTEKANVVVTQVLPLDNGCYGFTARNTSGKVFQNDQAVRFYLWYQQTLFLFEDNIIELQLKPAGFVSTTPTGIYLRGPEKSLEAPDSNPYRITYKEGLKDVWTYRFVSLRDNLIRKVGDRLDPDSINHSWGIRVDTVENLIAEGNVIGRLNNAIDPYREPQVFAYGVTERKKSFNNQHPGGKLRQLFNDPSWKDNNAYWMDEIATLAEDWVWVGDAKKMIF